MLATTEGIVLHFIKYGETSVIAAIYTKEFGKQSFIINAIRNRKSKSKINLLQPLFLVEFVTYQKQNREIQRIKEFKTSEVYQNIPYDILKSTQAILLAEILYKTINEQESYPEMFEFIQNTLLYFDLMDKGTANFHLWFLIHLTEYLGFLPDISQVGLHVWFDLRKGSLVSREPSHPLFIDKDATNYFIRLAKLKIHELVDFSLPRNLREYLLTQIIEYYQLHFENLGEIKSLKVLRESFR